MGEKVKLTREQAKAIELIKHSKTEDERLIDSAITMRDSRVFTFTGTLETLNELLITDFAKALYIGYEIKPPYKLKEWVIFKGAVVQIIEIYGRSPMSYVLKSPKSHYRVGAEKIERHATTEEIESQWWKNNNRDVWELKEKDVVIDRFNRIREIHEDDGDTVSYFDGLTSSKEYVKETCRVVCFAEDRKDV